MFFIVSDATDFVATRLQILIYIRFLVIKPQLVNYHIVYLKLKIYDGPIIVVQLGKGDCQKKQIELGE